MNKKVHKEKKVLLLTKKWEGLADELRPWLQEKGYGLDVTDTLKYTLVHLHIDKSICLLIIEESHVEGGLYEVINTIKEMYSDLLVIVAIEENDPIKERQVRLKGE